MTDNKQRIRNSSFELLRIISIVLIIFSHCANYRWYQIGCQDFSVAQFWLNLISMGGKIGVNCFLFISAFYLVEDKKILNLTKVVKIFLTCIFYFVVFYVFSLFCYKNNFSFSYFLKNFFFPIQNNWWFIKIYLIILLIHPLLNLIINNCNDLELSIAIVVTFALSFVTEHVFYFIFLYFLTAILKRNIDKLNRKALITIMIVGFVLAYSGPLLVGLLFDKTTSFFEINKYFVGENSPLMLAIAIPLSLLFAKKEPFENKFINFVAPSTLSIYIIHEDRIIMRNFIWGDLFKVGSFQTSNYFILYTIFACLTVFVCCVLIDLIKRYTFDALLNPFYKKLAKLKINNLKIAD